ALLTQKAYAEGLRALYLFTAAHQDPQAASVVSGADADMAERVNDLLLPIVKGVGSERAYQCLTESLQTFGGSGFLQDYPIEQYIRDAKIDSLYEGTTAIQAQDFFFRKIVRDQGAALGHLVTQIESFIDSEDARPELVEARKQLATAVDDLQAWVATMTGYLMDSQQSASELYRVGLESVPFLLAVGDLLIGWLLLQQAEIALTALDGDPSPADSAFYAGKITTARFFVKNVLPRLTAEREIAANVDLSVMQLREEAF
ncbi:MAG TPA: acyl-CoA dehydrogenase, partial [Mycobacterium sp.]|nr:acyl-CoA dehydrogenase [Mycobacterium sp.]